MTFDNECTYSSIRGNPKGQQLQRERSSKKGRAVSDPALEFHMVEGETGEPSCIMRGELRITGMSPHS